MVGGFYILFSINHFIERLRQIHIIATLMENSRKKSCAANREKVKALGTSFFRTRSEVDPGENR